jgi:hypothetical protein
MFCDSWQKGQEWLKFDDDELFFKYQHYKNDSNEIKNLRGQNTFLTGGSNLKSVVENHDKSKGHKKDLFMFLPLLKNLIHISPTSVKQ